MATGGTATLPTIAMRLAPILFAAGVAHLAFQIWKHWDVVTLDFRFFWLAGEFWLRGDNPYDPAYAAEAASLFDIRRGAIWYYAPNWFPLAALLSLPDPLTASRMWLFANAVLLIASCGLNVAAFRSMSKSSGLRSAHSPMTAFLNEIRPRTLFFALAGAIGLAQATGNTLHLGQSSMLIYFGASVLTFGAARGHLVVAALGLAILMLKPQIGLLVCAGLVFTTFGRRCTAAAAAISALAALPAFFAATPADVVSGFLGGVTQYADQSYNMPPAVTGLRHIVWILGGPDMGSPFYLFLALAMISALGLLSLTRRKSLRTVDFIAISIAVAAATSPLHVYDFTLLGAIALYAIALPFPAGPAALAAFAVMMRAGNLPHPASLADGVTYYAGSAYASLSAAAIAATIALSLLDRQRRKAPSDLAVRAVRLS